MATRSLNKVMLIGNLTRDPELRYTPAGTAVCTFGLATNRTWTTQAGEVKEETEFHRIVAWNKLGELCAQLLAKGRKVYVEGRLATHSWAGQDGLQHTTTEVVIDDMIVLDSKRPVKEMEQVVSAEKLEKPVSQETKETKEETKEQSKEEKEISQSSDQTAVLSEKITDDQSAAVKKSAKTKVKKEKEENETITPNDIPF